MKHLLLTTIAAVVLVGCGPSVDIHEATKEGNIVFVRRGLSKGADVNAVDSDGFTVLHLAVANNHKNIVELLVAKGADINANTRGLGFTPLHFAVMDEKKNMAQLLITKGADINAKDDDGFTPLHWTAIKGHKEIVELLIDNGANVNPKGDEFGMTPLHKAASKGHREITELLIANGADVNAKVVSSPTARTALLEGSTPLETAKNKETFDLIRKHGGKTGEELKAEGK